MTAEELQSIVLRLANNVWCRYWLNLNHPQNPRTMAIQCLDWKGSRIVHPDGDTEDTLGPVPVPDLIKFGFKEEPDFLYTIDRTNSDGTPYEGNLL